METIRKILMLAAVVMVGACSEKGLDLQNEDESGSSTVSHEMIVLGNKMEDPYSCLLYTSDAADDSIRV